MTTTEPPVDVDTLPPTQYLLLEVLAARYRLGESYWTFPDRCAPPARALEQAGLIWTRSGPAQNCFEARFTDAGRTAALSDAYTPPIARHTPGHTWDLPAEPGAEVTAVRDQYGVRWRRDHGLWWGNIGHGYDDHRTWAELLRRGPLTPDSATPPLDMRYPAGHAGWLGEYQPWPCARCGREEDASERHDCQPPETTSSVPAEEAQP